MNDDMADIATLHDRYRFAIDSIPGLVWTSLPDGDVDFLNQRWLDYTGLSFEQAIGCGWQAAVCPDDLPRLVESWNSIVESGQPGEFEARLRRHDGGSLVPVPRRAAARRPGQRDQMVRTDDRYRGPQAGRGGAEAADRASR
jgi:PAS domain S-box-containing protein